MKKRFLSVALAAAVAMSATACTSNPAESKTTAAPAETKAEETTAAEASSEGEKKEAAADGDLITVGYAQVGAESDWRTANTESFKSTFTEENGYKLIFDDARFDTHPSFFGIDLNDAVHIARHVNNNALVQRLTVGPGAAAAWGKNQRREKRFRRQTSDERHICG